jgi:hypothetical protein
MLMALVVFLALKYRHANSLPTPKGEKDVAPVLLFERRAINGLAFLFYKEARGGKEKTFKIPFDFCITQVLRPKG